MKKFTACLTQRNDWYVDTQTTGMSFIWNLHFREAVRQTTHHY